MCCIINCRCLVTDYNSILCFSRPVCLSVKHQSGAQVQICVIVRQYADLLVWGVSEEKMGLLFTIAAGLPLRSRIYLLWTLAIIILSSSNSAPLNSGTICWNIVATTVNMSFRDELFALGPEYLLLVVPRRKGHSSLSVWQDRPVQRRAMESSAVVVCCSVAPPARTVLGWCSWKRTPFPLYSWAFSATFPFASLSSASCQSHSNVATGGQ